MKTHWTDKALDGLIEYGPALMLTLTQKRKSRAVRMLGFFAHFVWCIPMAVLTIVPLFFLMGAALLHKAWEGEL